MTDKPETVRPTAIHDLNALTKAEVDQLLIRTEQDLGPFLELVEPIIAAVKTDGDQALVHFAAKFDAAQIGLAEIAVSESEFQEAENSLPVDLIETLHYAADNIRRFHEEQMPGEMWTKEIRPGVLVGERHTPVESAALYSPRGKGSFPSVTLMTAIPAIVAGVKNPIIVTPTGPDGKVDAGTLVAAKIAGVDQVFKAGGAVAVAAAAFGTETVPKCHVIEGPGSPWVVAAKRLLSGTIASSVRAGPTESMLFCDETADPYLVALDTLIEAEHGPDSSVFTVVPTPEFAARVAQEIERLYQHMSVQRAEFARTVLGGANGGIVIARDLRQGYDFVNAYAPEHLQVMSKHPFEHLAHITEASEILLGECAPSSIANYVMGPNAVLPTSGAAKFGSPLGVHAFLKSASIAHVSQSGFHEMAPHTERFARYEGFDAHANAVSSLRRAGQC